MSHHMKTLFYLLLLSLLTARAVCATTSSKSTLTTSSTSKLSTTSPTTTATAGPACPSSNATTYTTPNADIFHITCSVDFPGGDVSSTTASTFAACLAACSTTSGCIGVSYSAAAAQCYMKSVLQPPVSNTGVWGATLGDNVPSGPACPGSDGTLFTSPTPYGYNRYWSIQCGKDLPNGNLAAISPISMAGCLNTCANTSGCVAAAYLSPSCYMKQAGYYGPVAVGNNQLAACRAAG